MMQTQDYAGNTISIESDCPACAYARHEFSLPCGMAYEDDMCTVSQDWQLPISGMMIVAPIRHVKLFEEMTKEERVYLFEVVNNVISILRKAGVSKDFNVIFEEKKSIHFHIWILPRDGFKEIGIDPTKDIRKLQQYALANLNTKDNLEKIAKISKLVGQELRKIYKA